MLNNKYFYFITEHDLNLFTTFVVQVFNYPINLKVKHKIQTIFFKKNATKNEFEIINFKTD